MSCAEGCEAQRKVCVGRHGGRRRGVWEQVFPGGGPERGKEEYKRAVVGVVKDLFKGSPNRKALPSPHDA